MIKVSYIHSKGYRVSRRFNTMEGAQQFISSNALVFPLPGVRVTDETEPVSTDVEDDVQCQANDYGFCRWCGRDMSCE